MQDRGIRLAKALSNEGVKRLPWIFLIFIVLLFIQFVRFNAQTAENTRIAKSNSVDTKTLLVKVAALSEDNKQLTEQNIQLARENATHLDCIAKLFVGYTQNKRAITDYDLSTCIIATTVPDQSAAQPSTPSSQQSKSNQSVASSSPQGNTSSGPGQPNNSQSEDPDPALLDCKVDILFVHIGCP